MINPKNNFIIGISVAVCLLTLFSCEKEKPVPVDPGFIELVSAKIGDISIISEAIVPTGSSKIDLGFDKAIDKNTFSAISLKTVDGQAEALTITVGGDGKTLELKVNTEFRENTKYILTISSDLKGSVGEKFTSKILNFVVANDPLLIDSLKIGSRLISDLEKTENIGSNPEFTLFLSHDISEAILAKTITLGKGTGNDASIEIKKLGAKKYSIHSVEALESFKEYRFRILESLGSETGKMFVPKEYLLFTSFEKVDDEALLNLVQERSFQYFWEFGHPVSGMSRERNTSGDVVTTGGTGFGIMAMIVGVERGFITRNEALGRWEIMVSFLKNADRYHGVWSHWINGSSGKTIPFSPKDNGADLVESAFMVQGLLTLRQYLNPNIAREAVLIDKINLLWKAVEWDWFTRSGQKVLYWHWSPDFNWEMNLPIRGHNEGLIIYVLAASSPTHTIDASVYHQGYARNGAIKNGNSYYGINLPLGSGRGGPLFFAHYSFLGLDPRKLQDKYANYWQQNTNHTLINRAYCIANPLKYKGYGETCWGLTASDNNKGYSAHSPDNDKGVITPTAALSSMPYTPTESMTALKHFYYDLGDKTWGPYGFYDAFNQSANWYADSYLAIDQGPIVDMIENHRSGLLWRLFMSAPEIQEGLTKLGFTY